MICGNRQRSTDELGADVLLQVSKRGGTAGEWSGSRSPIRVTCQEGHTWDAWPYDLLDGHWCPMCNKPGLHKDAEQAFRAKCQELGYCPVKYEGSRMKHLLRCETCRKTVAAIPRYLKRCDCRR
jgi:hypothetical protein